MTRIVEKAGLYFHTVKYMKASQVCYRIRKKVGMGCGIGCRAQADPGNTHMVKPVPELDLDPLFLSRFNVSGLMNDRVSFLHVKGKLNRNGIWEIKENSPLWNYNLHYFEFLFPLLNAHRNEGNPRYMKQAVSLILSWIEHNPREGGGPGWAPYTIDLRLTNWLSFYAMAEADLSEECKKSMVCSIREQYEYLSRHIEKDILGNHYFEDLKALVLCAVFFDDRTMLDKAYAALLKECREEILEDGMHFELSPMYHRLILEGLIKVYAALRDCGYQAAGLEPYIQAMLDAMWSIEESLNRIPLFNDCGNNVAKSMNALVAAANVHLGMQPVFRSMFPKAGFYIFKHKNWKLIVDAGQPGPAYIPGHAHCDALSFELYRDGEPVISNCGTYAYQSDLRNVFRATAAHNTVMINGAEQSQCWGAFRMAKRSSVLVIEADGNHISAEMEDYKGQRVRRTIRFDEELTVIDESEGNRITGFIHPLQDVPIEYNCDAITKAGQLYAPEYGCLREITALEYSGENRIAMTVKTD